MKKIIICASILAITPLSANAVDWGNIFGIMVNNAVQTQASKTTATADVSKTLNDLESQAKAIDKSVQDSFLAIASKLSAEKDLEALENKLDSIVANNKTTDSEKAELIAQVFNDYTKELKNNKQSVVSIIENMTESERADLAKYITAIAQDGQNYPNVAKQSISTASTAMKYASKAEEAVKIYKDIKSTATELTNSAKTIINVANQLKSIAKTAGLTM